MSEQAPPTAVDDEPDDTCNAMALKATVACLAVGFIAAPVAYGAYEIHVLSTPVLDSWRWPVIFVMGIAFCMVAWWVVSVIHRNFPYS